MAVASAVPDAMNQSAFAKLAGVSRKQVTVQGTKGLVFLDGQGLVDVPRSVALLEDRDYHKFGSVTQAVTPEPEVTVAPQPPSRQSAADEEGGCQRPSWTRSSRR